MSVTSLLAKLLVHIHVACTPRWEHGGRARTDGNLGAAGLDDARSSSELKVVQLGADAGVVGGALAGAVLGDGSVNAVKTALGDVIAGLGDSESEEGSSDSELHFD